MIEQGWRNVNDELKKTKTKTKKTGMTEMMEQEGRGGSLMSRWSRDRPSTSSGCATSKTTVYNIQNFTPRN